MSFQIGSNFRLRSQLPLDEKSVVANLTERNAIVTNNEAYNGLIVYVISDSTYYSYNGTSWTPLNQGASLKFQYISSSGGGTTATLNTKIGADTSAASFILNLPVGAVIGDVIEIIDINKTFHLNNLIIRSNTDLIEGVGFPGLTCNVQGAHFLLIYVGGTTGWEISIIDNNFSTAGVLSDSSVLPLLFLNIQENNNSELFDTNDIANYKIPWNNIEYINNEYVTVSSTIDNTKYITYNPTTKNLYIREPGIYNVDLRYSSYNLRDASDFLRARLRNWDTEIPGGLSQNSPLTDVGVDANNNPLPYGPLQGGGFRAKVLAAFAQGPIGTTFNGEAMCAGFTTFKITTPQYIVADFLHAGALRIIAGEPDQTWGYPVYLGPYGNIPFMFISKIV